MLAYFIACCPRMIPLPDTLTNTFANSTTVWPFDDPGRPNKLTTFLSTAAFILRISHLYSLLLLELLPQGILPPCHHHLVLRRAVAN